MALEKPPAVAADEFKSAKWDELIEGRDFTAKDSAALAMLCQWYKLAALSMDELDSFGDQTAYQNKQGDLKTFPQVNSLASCCLRIDQLERRLGLNEVPKKAADEEKQKEDKPTTLYVIRTRAEKRRRGAV